MTDEELIESLRLWNRDDAADRIEALVKERDKYRDAFNTNCLVLRGTEARAERLEAALRKIDVGEGWAAQIAREAFK